MGGAADTAIAMFAKAPRPGAVKTRLAGVLTAGGSAGFHRECALATWERLERMPWLDRLFYCDRHWQEFQERAGPGRFRLQSGPGLGDRMRRCLDDLLAAGYRHALIVGSDAPTFPRSMIEEAVAALGEADVVLAPSDDGGFALVGAACTEPGMFDDVAWSTSDTREECIRALESAGLAVAVTRARAYDVDTPSDLERLRADPALPSRLRLWFDERAASSL